MNKRAIAILGAIFLLIVGTLGFLIYSKYSGNKSQTPPVAGNNNSTSTPPGNSGDNTASTTPILTNPPGPVLLTLDQIVSPALFFNGSGITYFDHSGNLFQVNLQENNSQLILANKKQLGIPAKTGIVKILWPAKGNDFIALTTGLGHVAYSYFNSASGAYTDLPSQMESIDWMPSGSKIVYAWVDAGKAVLSTADPDGKNYKKLSDLWETDDSFHVSPDGLSILVYETANSSVNNTIRSVTSDGKLWKALVTTGQNFGVMWSPDSEKFLFGKKDASTQKYQLWVYNIVTGETKSLGLFTTTDKTVWDKDSNIIYAAVPSSGTPGDNSLTVDNFYRLDTTTLEKKQYQAGSGASFDGRDLFLNSTSDKLFFRNAQDGGLYYLDLAK